MFETVTVFIFAFTLGGLSFMVAAVFATYTVLKRLSSSERENIPPQHKKINRKFLQNLDRELAGSLKIHAGEERISKDDVGMMAEPWLYAVLKDRALFTYSDDKRNDKISLDGCDVTLANKTNWAARSNSVLITHPTRVLVRTEDPTGAGPPVPHRSCRLFFPNGQALEEWYFALKREIEMQHNRESILETAEQALQYFSHLSKCLQPRIGEDFHSAWFNAVIGRFWWNLYDNNSFHKLLMKAMAKRISKMTNFPKFIESMKLDSIYVGPYLPLFSNIELITISDRGEVTVDGDLRYNGGFEIGLSVNTKVNLPGTSVEIPATAHLKVDRLFGRLRLQMAPPPCERFWVGFHEEPQFDVTCDTEIGIGSKHGGQKRAKALPKTANSVLNKLRSDLTNIIANKIKSDIINEKMVLPNMDDFPIPYWRPEPGDDDHDEYMNVSILEPQEQEVAQKPKARPLLRISATGVSILNQKIFATGDEDQDDGAEESHEHVEQGRAILEDVVSSTGSATSAESAEELELRESGTAAERVRGRLQRSVSDLVKGGKKPPLPLGHSLDASVEEDEENPLSLSGEGVIAKPKKSTGSADARTSPAPMTRAFTKLKEASAKKTDKVDKAKEHKKREKEKEKEKEAKREKEKEAKREKDKEAKREKEKEAKREKEIKKEHEREKEKEKKRT